MNHTLLLTVQITIATNVTYQNSWCRVISIIFMIKTIFEIDTYQWSNEYYHCTSHMIGLDFVLQSSNSRTRKKCKVFRNAKKKIIRSQYIDSKKIRFPTGSKHWVELDLNSNCSWFFDYQYTFYSDKINHSHILSKVTINTPSHLLMHL